MIEEILADVRDLSLPISNIRTPGVYFLFSKGELVYIGHSGACEARVNGHVWEGRKEFDAFTIVKIDGDRSRRMKMERDLLDEYRPIYNPPPKRHIKPREDP